ncbi:hypothetical protein BKA62DRAFT_356792 [Auriculariales sp. MPI-PUGE-AT-0066]|nr:hypothetical protein BKA62DRAFT_356792 [Auriculariales sp. MPI-PUGE-AT-0066]
MMQPNHSVRRRQRPGCMQPNGKRRNRLYVRGRQRRSPIGLLRPFNKARATRPWDKMLVTARAVRTTATVAGGGTDPAAAASVSLPDAARSAAAAAAASRAARATAAPSAATTAAAPTPCPAPTCTGFATDSGRPARVVVVCFGFGVPGPREWPILACDATTFTARSGPGPTANANERARADARPEPACARRYGAAFADCEPQRRRDGPVCAARRTGPRPGIWACGAGAVTGRSRSPGAVVRGSGWAPNPAASTKVIQLSEPLMPIPGSLTSNCALASLESYTLPRSSPATLISF